MKDKLLFSILGVVAISCITFGATYAYYASSVSDTITGEARGGLTTTLTLDTTYKASKLVPLQDSLVKTAISKDNNKCIDASNYEVCSLYKITLTNTSSSETLYGYIRTNTSTYTTDNLKYQIFDSSYNALTDVITLSKTADTTVYFEKSSSNYSVTSTGTTTFYLAIWLTDTGENQSADYSKTFSGYIGFESVDYAGTDTGKIEAGFNT